MNDTVLDKIRQMAEQAKHLPDSSTIKVRLVSGVNSLSEVIKTKEQAQQLIKSIKAL